jgi:putative membrane protein
VRGVSSEGASAPRNPEDAKVPRRTWLAAERTWLAWLRTGLAVTALALAVGRVLPSLTHGARWPFEVLGLGYGMFAIAVVVAGGLRQRRAAHALRHGGLDELSGSLVTAFTVAVVALCAATIAVIGATL